MNNVPSLQLHKTLSMGKKKKKGFDIELKDMPANGTNSQPLQEQAAQEPPKVVAKEPMCPRSHSIRSISNAKVKTVKLTVVVVLGYMLCSAPFVCVQLYTVLGNPSPGVSKYSYYYINLICTIQIWFWVIVLSQRKCVWPETEVDVDMEWEK